MSRVDDGSSAGLLEDLAEVLLRQVHPNYVENGSLSSQPFRPTPKDSNKLSVDRSSIFSAEQSFNHYTAEMGLASVAVYGLTVGEFKSEVIECTPDPIVEDEENGVKANPAHSFADYAPHNGSKQKNIAKRLKLFAVARGCLYTPPTT